MGIQNDAILFYGISFEFDEVKHLIGNNFTSEIKDIFIHIIDSDIDINDKKRLKRLFMNLWEELYHSESPDIETASVSCYFDASSEDHTYLLGIRLKNEISIKEINELNDIEQDIMNFCEKYNFSKKELKIMCLADVS